MFKMNVQGKMRITNIKSTDRAVLATGYKATKVNEEWKNSFFNVVFVKEACYKAKALNLQNKTQIEFHGFMEFIPSMPENNQQQTIKMFVQSFEVLENNLPF